MRKFEVDTSHGRLDCVETRGAGTTVLFIHGNSSCKEIFARQLGSELGSRYRMIAFDLPGLERLCLGANGGDVDAVGEALGQRGHDARV